jgi:hypothetical protein
VGEDMMEFETRLSHWKSVREEYSLEINLEKKVDTIIKRGKKHRNESK